LVEDEDLEVRVGLALFFDAYDEFERTGKITYLAKVCFKYPIFQKFFLQLMGKLEDPHNYPYFLKKQVDKLRDRKPHGRPKKDETILDWQLTFLKYAIVKHEYLASKNGEGVLTKKELIKRVTELETPDDRRISVVGLSQSSAYALFDKAKEYEPKDDELARRIYAEMMPFSSL
jgi:hypothetical protein